MVTVREVVSCSRFLGRREKTLWRMALGMMSMMRGIAVIAAVVLATTCTAAPADPVVKRTEDRLNAVLATVNGEPISLGDVLQLTEAKEFQAAAAFTGETLAKAVYALRLEAVDELIDNKLILADYATRSFEIPVKDVEAAVDDASSRMGCRSRSELARKLRENGSSLEEFRKKIREQLIIHVMIQREYISSNFITPTDLRNYYNEHAAEFDRPERIELALLQLSEKREDFRTVRDELSKTLAASPGRFEELVGRYSSGPSRGDGGKLGSIERKRLRSEFSGFLGENPVVGRVYGPVETPDGVFWLKVLAHVPAEKIPFEKSAAEIRGRLEKQLRHECRERYCARLRKGAIIRYFIPGGSTGKNDDDSDGKKQTSKHNGSSR